MSSFDLLGSLGSAPTAREGSPASGAPHEPGRPRCSRKGCRSDATWSVNWNNPKIHTPERRKIWLACDEHREWLENYLQVRDFWRSTEPFETPTPED